MEKQTVGKFIAALRKVNGMTQTELAEKLGVTNKSVSKWECDECYPDLSLIPVIAELFNVTSDEILKGGRITKNQEAITSESPKTERLTGRLIQNALSKFKYLSLISVFLIVAGFAFLSGSWLRDMIFVVGFLLTATISIILELVLANITKSALYNHDIENGKDKRLLAAT